MPRTVETTVYRYGELSDEAKRRARDWYREASAGDTYFSESVIEDAATIADMMGLDIRQRAVKLMDGSTRMEPAVSWSLFVQGSDVCFSGAYRYRKGSVAAIKAHASKDTELHRIAESLAAAQKRHGYALVATVHEMHRGSGCYSMEVEVEHSDNPYIDVSGAEKTIREAIQDFAHWIYRNLESECEYFNSDEAVIETIAANEYEFDEDGNRA